MNHVSSQYVNFLMSTVNILMRLCHHTYENGTIGPIVVYLKMEVCSCIR